MKKIFAFAVVGIALAGCSTPSDSPAKPDVSAKPKASAASDDSFVTNIGGPAPAKEITRATVEKCWKSVGFSGDLYKFMSPAEAAGLVRVGNSSKSQVAAFKACLTS